MPLAIPKKITIENDIMIGRVYKIKGKRMKCIGIYPPFARFQDEFGITRSFLFWDLEHIFKDPHWEEDEEEWPS